MAKSAIKREKLLFVAETELQFCSQHVASVASSFSEESPAS